MNSFKVLLYTFVCQQNKFKKAKLNIINQCPSTCLADRTHLSDQSKIDIILTVSNSGSLRASIQVNLRYGKITRMVH